MRNTTANRGAKLACGVLIGGMGAGMLMAMAVPTSMKRQAEDWRDLIGVRDATAATTPVLAFEAPPEDLSPVSWQTASEEYPALAVQDQIADFPDNFDTDVPDYSEQSLSEPLPSAMLAVNYGSNGPASLDTSDAAGNAAQAARDAAADVRKAELAAARPSPSQASQARPRPASANLVEPRSAVANDDAIAPGVDSGTATIAS